MSPRLLRGLSPLLLLVPALLALRCPEWPIGPEALVIAAPGERVETRTVEVEIQLDDGHLDPATLRARLNGEPVALQGGPKVFTATLEPGAPLRDQNRLQAQARVRGSAGRTAALVSFRYAPPKARAHRIESRSELLEGPLAHNRLGDWMLENDVARYVIQDVAKRDLHSVGTYGGNLIDAELVEKPGTDQFFELQPAVNIETVLNAQDVEVVNDGSDGSAAVLRTCGPDDLIDYVNPSTQVGDFGFPLPPGVDDEDKPIEGCTEYRLEPGARSLEIETTLVNTGSEEVGLYVGDFVNGMGALEQWTRSTNTGQPTGMGEVLATFDAPLLGYLGYGDAAGVDYALLQHPTLPGASSPGSTFTISGVSFMLHSQSIPLVLALGLPPELTIPPGESRSFSRHFAVGDGSLSNAVALENEVKGVETGQLRGCVTVGGEPAPDARVAVGSARDGRIRSLASHFTTDASGCYAGPLPSGSYSVAASAVGVPYEGGGPTPVLHEVSVAPGESETLDVALPATGRVEVDVRDADGHAIPARVTVVGFDPSPPLGIDSSAGPVDGQTATFLDLASHGPPFGVTRAVYTGADGRADFRVEPGEYEVVVSRGTEYSARRERVSVGAGGVAEVSARIARVLETPGFVSSDFHVHMLNSPDSRVSLERRVRQFSGEGTENIVATDHDAHTDLDPTIRELDLEPWLSSMVGEEITTFDYGHFNAYPQGVDESRPSGGSTDWAGAAPPGEGFVEDGAFSLTPAEIQDAAKSGPRAPSGVEPVVQVNHIDSYFGPLRIDTALVPPRSDISEAEARSFRLDPAVGDYFEPFEALELWNGMTRGHQGEFLEDRIGIWMNHLNQGILTTAITDTDTHGFLNLRTAGARSWTASPTDEPSEIGGADVAEAVRAGRVVGGQGLYVQARLRDPDDPSRSAHLGLGGSRLLSVPSGEVELEIHVQAPLWGEYDRIEIYANETPFPTGSEDGVPVLYDAEPSRVLTAGDANEGDRFLVETVEVAPDVPGGERLETQRSVRLEDLAEDTWVVVVARGSDGVSRPLFPVMPFSLQQGGNDTLDALTDGNLGERGVLALGFTNPLLVDVDGNGVFDAPWTR